MTSALGALVIPSLRSPNFVTGVSGWEILKSGNVEFNNGIFRGTVDAATIIASVIESASLAPGTEIDASGNIKVFNSHGAIVVFISPADDGVFIYIDTGSAAQGALVSSMSGKAGNDPVNGTPFIQGINNYTVIGTDVFATGLNQPIGSFPAFTIADIQNPPNQPAGMLAVSGNGASPHAQAALESGATTATDVGSNIEVQSQVDSGQTNGLATISAGLTRIGFANTLVVDDNAGLVEFSTILVDSTFSGKIPATQTDTTTIPSGNVTSPTAITHAYTIDTITLTVGTVYTLKTWFNGTWGLTVLELFAIINGTATAVGTVGAAFATGAAAGDAVNGWLELEIEIVSATACRLHMSGGIHDNTVNANNSDTAGSIISGTVATGVAIAANDTIEIGVAFNASAVGQTIQTQGSRLLRSGS